ncbi:MAG: DUF1934 domain-containing protein [Bacilli bacterium]|jgi:uncharacterized beta-barrel protein YwiB (DUF1934 family)|nr:DUF1934 domain-containing protein [Bacilli bacterium]
MSKIKIKAHLQGPDTNHMVEGSGIAHDHKLLYQDGDIKVIVAFQDEKVILKRIHPEYQLTLIFLEQQTTSGKYQLMNYSSDIPLSITTNRLQVSDQKLEVDYHLAIGDEEHGHFTFILEYEVKV